MPRQKRYRFLYKQEKWHFPTGHTVFNVSKKNFKLVWCYLSQHIWSFNLNGLAIIEKIVSVSKSGHNLALGGYWCTRYLRFFLATHPCRTLHILLDSVDTWACGFGPCDSFPAAANSVVSPANRSINSVSLQFADISDLIDMAGVCYVVQEVNSKL